MENKKNIYSKLLEFQKLNISVIKNGKNPHFKSNYATLNEVLDKVKKPLNDLGVVIIFEPQIDSLVTILYDTESNTQVSGCMKYIGAENAQKLLACNTYYRRGSLVSLLGLEDEDDDGATAVKPIIKPELKEGTQLFEMAKKAVSEGTVTIADIEKKYTISEKVQTLLTTK